MKCFIVAILFCAVTRAEPPAYRTAWVQYQRQELGGSASEREPTTAVPETVAAPYPPSGWKPAGRAFFLPQTQQTYPQQTYPQQTYPQQTYSQQTFPQLAYPQQTYSLSQNYLPPPAYTVLVNGYNGPANTYGIPVIDYVPAVTPQPTPTTEVATEPEPTTEAPTTEAPTTAVAVAEAEAVAVIETVEPSQNLVAETPSKYASEGAYYIILPDSSLQRVVFYTQNDLEKMEYIAKVQYQPQEQAPIFYYTPEKLYQYGYDKK